MPRTSFNVSAEVSAESARAKGGAEAAGSAGNSRRQPVPNCAILLPEARLRRLRGAPGGIEPALSALQPSDEALWMLGDIYCAPSKSRKTKTTRTTGRTSRPSAISANHQGLSCSRRAADAKARLTAMGMPVPAPDPNAEAEMKQTADVCEAAQPVRFSAVTDGDDEVLSRREDGRAQRAAELEPARRCHFRNGCPEAGRHWTFLQPRARPAAAETSASAPEQGAPVEAVSVQQDHRAAQRETAWEPKLLKLRAGTLRHQPALKRRRRRSSARIFFRPRASPLNPLRAASTSHASVGGFLGPRDYDGYRRRDDCPGGGGKIRES